jgi:hypothetical protein
VFAAVIIGLGQGFTFGSVNKVVNLIHHPDNGRVFRYSFGTVGFFQDFQAHLMEDTCHGREVTGVLDFQGGLETILSHKVSLRFDLFAGGAVVNSFARYTIV